MSYTVFRLDKSQYQNDQFILDEKAALEKIPGIKYTNLIQGLDKNQKIIMLSTSQTKVREIPQILLKDTVLLIHPNSGWDNFDTDFINSAKFPLIVGNNIRAKAVAEYSLSCLYHFFNPLHQDHHWDDSRQWNRNLIRDQKIIIYGWGHIGKLVYDSLSPIVSKLIVIDPYAIKENSKNKFSSVADDFLKDTDVIILCNDLNKSSKHMINEQFLAKLKKPFLIINGARGKLIDQTALIKCLQKYPECYAYLDVFEKEPFSPGEFMQIKNLNKTSHIAGVHNLLNADIIKFEKAVIEDFIHAQQLSNIQQFNEKYQHINMKTRLSIYGEG